MRVNITPEMCQPTSILLIFSGIGTALLKVSTLTHMDTSLARYGSLKEKEKNEPQFQLSGKKI